VASVIKSDRTPVATQEPRGFSLGDFVAEGEQIIAAARARAQEIVAEARAAAARLGEDAYRKGHEKGYQVGREEGRATGSKEALTSASADFQARLVQLASACEANFREVDRSKRELMEAAHRDLLSLAVAIAERVTKRIGLIDRRAVVDNLLSVVDRVGSWSDLVVEVSSTDAQTLEQFAPDLVAARGGLKHVEVRVNESIAPGGCIARTRGGRIDATLDTQLKRIAEELLPGTAETS
jgi:flagellar assembly protein FliH